MPWLSALNSFGDTSALTRFVIGLDEALRDYRGSDEAPLLRNPGLSKDPWNEDLFYRHLPVLPPVLGQEKDDSTEGGSPGAMLPDPHQNPLLNDRGVHAPFWDERFDEPGILPSSPSSRFVAVFMALAGLLAAMLPTTMCRYTIRVTKEPNDPVPAKTTCDAE
jgi:hypothetical protein